MGWHNAAKTVGERELAMLGQMDGEKIFEGERGGLRGGQTEKTDKHLAVAKYIPTDSSTSGGSSPFPSSSEDVSHRAVGEVAVHNGTTTMTTMTTTSLIDLEKQRKREAEGHAKFHQLGWKRLTIVLIVTAIALGSLSLPGAFATLGMVAGVIVTVGLGMVAMYTSYVIGQMKIKYPQIAHFADVGRLMFGRPGYEILGVMFSLQLVFTTGSHVLAGKIMFNNLTDNGACSIAFGIVSAIILFLLAIPPSFAEMAILGYIDFASIVAAILITIIATGVRAGDLPGGIDSVNWSAWPKEDLHLAEAFIAICNIVFAYSFSLCQFSFMDEMHTPEDFPKSILSLGIIEIVIYTLTGSLVYAFVGKEVQSPALLSAGPLVSKVAFGVALPVIFISGSINTVVVGRYLHGRIFRDSPEIQYINTRMGWLTWIGLGAGLTLLAWVVAEAIPFFPDLLAICSSLFISGFTFYLPAIMWFWFIKEGKWYETKRNIGLSMMNAGCLIIGLIVLGVGTYSSVEDILHRYATGAVGEPFTCKA